MANGAETEEYVVLTSIRPGLKREFAFALKSQAECAGSFGRTRTRRSQNGAVGEEKYKDCNKRLKSFVPKNVKSAADNCSVKCQSVTGLEELMNDEATEDDKMSDDKMSNVIRYDFEMMNSISEEEPKSDVVDSISDDEQKSVLAESFVKKNVTERSIALPEVENQPEQCTIDTPAVNDDAKMDGSEVWCDEGRDMGAELPVLGFDAQPGDGVVYGKPVEVMAKPLERLDTLGLKTDEASKRDVMPKLELKMSKTIELKKCPTKLKQLLDTGLLEGMPVRYLRGPKTRGAAGDGLRGIIRGSGILCSCYRCSGIQVVTPNLFELHAGSGNKRPPDYIYLDNGNTLRDVLNACKNAPIESLEVSIRNVIGCLSADKNIFCMNCRSSTAEDSGRAMQLCSSCMIMEVSQRSTASMHDKKVSQRSPASMHNVKESQPSPASMQDMKESQPSPALMRHKKDRSQTTPCQKSSNSVVGCSSQRSKTRGRITRKDLRLHKLVFENDILPDGTELAYYARGQKCVEGYKKGLGIFCFCCQSEVSPSQFEAHAGWASRRKPYLHIYTSNGVSLHELALKLSKVRKLTEEENDDLCLICADGGDLLCCDNCPRAFHLDCVLLPCIPTGTWYCTYCQSMFQRERFVESNKNAVAAGRLPGIDPLEEITRRCIRIVGTLEAAVGGCALCRGHDFSKSGFGPQTVIICDQCEKEYHVGCLKEHEMDDLKELPVGKWFCCKGCSRIHSALQELVVSGDKSLPEPLLNIVMKKLEGKGSEGGAEIDIGWCLLSGRRIPEAIDVTKLLSKAVSIFHDRFDPVADSNTGVADLIPHMVFGRKVKDQDFGGMYCAILKVNSNIVSAGIIRIFGEEVAELPLVATNTDCQGQGYFQVLFSCIENLLVSLNVKKLVLPAADEAESLWTNKFGFDKIPSDELMKYKKDHQMMIFQGTSMLHKSVVSG